MKPFHYNQDPLYNAAASILTGQPLTEEIVAFKNLGFKLLNDMMEIEDIHDIVNSTIKSMAQKIGKNTWGVVTDIYGKPTGTGDWNGDWILQRKDGGAWLTIKNGGPFKPHEDISSVVSEFELQEEMKDMEKIYNDFKSLIGKQVLHGSPGYATKEVITSITPHQTKKGSFEIEFESGVLDVLSQDELYDLIDGNEVEYYSPHGGMGVIQLKEQGENEIEIEENYGMGTATITSPGHVLDGKQANIFHKFDDGRINVQYKKSPKKGDVVNITLTKGQYKLDVGEKIPTSYQYKMNEETVSLSTPVLKDILRALETQRFSDWYENDFLDYIQGEASAKSEQEILKDLVDLINR